MEAIPVQHYANSKYVNVWKIQFGGSKVRALLQGVINRSTSLK
jgi:hypothetical protein